MSSLTANDLKTKGIAAIEAILAERPQAIVTVRGKDRFVVMEIEQTREKIGQITKSWITARLCRSGFNPTACRAKARPTWVGR
jgi:hypothetical protein